MATTCNNTVVTAGRTGGERGSALIAVLLLLLLMSGLVSALALGSQTESYISRNQNSGAQAQAAAEVIVGPWMPKAIET